MPRTGVLAASLCLSAILSLAVESAAQEYRVIVASEAADAVSHLTFAAGRLTLDRTTPIGLMPTDIDGPHGIAFAPDGRSYFVTLAHGQPNGALWQMATRDDRPIGRVTLGMFPATAQATPDGEFVYVVNFNLHGDRVPSSVSVVATSGLLEVARIPTCLMPHGSRISPDGTRQYSTCMMDDTLVEIDTRTLKASRHFALTAGREAGSVGPPRAAASSAGAAHTAGHGTEAPPPGSTACSPTWAQPAADGRRLFAACNGTSEIVEVDVDRWSLVRRIPAGPGVYNLAVTKSTQRLIATNRRGQSVSVFDAASGKELARVATKRRVVHGIAVSADDRYAFISVEGVGGDPGTVEVLDLDALKMIASLDVPPQAGGIDVRQDPPPR
jgi:DNA-binding beta-propeller fold protein YncE